MIELSCSIDITIFELTLISCTIVVFEFAFTMSFSLHELPFIIRPILKHLFSFSMLFPLDPLPLISPYRIFTHIESLPMRIVVLPLTFIKITVCKNKFTSALDSILLPFALVVHGGVKKHYS